jgi:hypothetical protein
MMMLMMMVYYFSSSKAQICLYQHMYTCYACTEWNGKKENKKMVMMVAMMTMEKKKLLLILHLQSSDVSYLRVPTTYAHMRWR